MRNVHGNEVITRGDLLPQAAGYLTRFEELQGEIAAKQAELALNPTSLCLLTQLGQLQRRAQWYQRRTPGSRHNIGECSLNSNFQRLRRDPSPTLDQPL